MREIRREMVYIFRRADTDELRPQRGLCEEYIHSPTKGIRTSQQFVPQMAHGGNMLRTSCVSYQTSQKCCIFQVWLIACYTKLARFAC